MTNAYSRDNTYFTTSREVEVSAINHARRDIEAAERWHRVAAQSPIPSK